MTNGTTIEEARQILGEDAIGMTDEQVADLLVVVHGLAGIIIDEYIAQNRPQISRQQAA